MGIDEIREDDRGFAARMTCENTVSKLHKKPSKVVPIIERKAQLLADRTIAPIVPRIYHEKWIWRKLFWLLCYLLCWFAFIMTVYHLIMKFRSYEVNTSLSIRYTKHMRFPAVTVCDLNILSKYKAAGSKTMADLSQAEDAMWMNVFKTLTDSPAVGNLDFNFGSSDCETYEFQCGNGECISDSFVCDFEGNCALGDDERTESCLASHEQYSTYQDLVSGQPATCAAFMYANAGAGNEIEAYTTNLTHCCDWDIESGKYLKVFPPYVVCDGFFHCNDRSDERWCEDWADRLTFCPKEFPIPILDENTVHIEPTEKLCMRLSPEKGHCNRWCVDSCLEASQVCDGVTDCASGIDEMGCGEEYYEYLGPANLDYFWNNDYPSDLIVNAFNPLEQKYLGMEADLFLTSDNSLYQHLLSTAESDPYYSAVRSAMMTKEEDLDKYGVQRQTLIQLCSYNNYACASSQETFDYFWETWFHQKYGRCFTFNHRATNFSQSDANYISATGQTTGLHLTLSVDENAYLPFMSPSVGAVISINTFDHFPMPELYPVILNPGTSNFLSLKKNSVLKLGHPFSDCIKEYPDFISENRQYLNAVLEKFLNAYDQYLCIQMCFSMHMLLSCQTGACRYGYLLDKHATKDAGYADCDMQNQENFNCYQHAQTKMVETENCECRQDCTSEFFTLFYSVGDFPSKTFVPFLLNSILTSDKNVLGTLEYNKWAQEVIDALRYVQKKVDDNAIENVTNILRKNLLDVRVYMGSMYVDIVRESEAYTWVNLLSDFGGDSGLYVGVCALSVFEILEFCWDVSFALIKRRFCGIVEYYDEDENDKKEPNGPTSSSV